MLLQTVFVPFAPYLSFHCDTVQSWENVYVFNTNSTIFWNRVKIMVSLLLKYIIESMLLISLLPCQVKEDGEGRPLSVMSLGVASAWGHSNGHPVSPMGVGSLWNDTDPRSPEPLVVRGGRLWLIWVVRGGPLRLYTCEP